MPIRILIVEDNSINRKIAQSILQRGGYQSVDLACDGQEAVVACSSREYNLVLMDCQMPFMDGLEATLHIRKLDKAQPVIIAITANAVAGQREKCLKSGMDDYLSKPYGSDQLLKLVDTYVSSRLNKGLSKTEYAPDQQFE